MSAKQVTKLRHIEKQIIQLLESEGTPLHYTAIARLTGMAPSTAGRCCTGMALFYPENLSYQKGTLQLLKPFDYESLKSDKEIIEDQAKVMKIQNQAIQSEQKKVDIIKEFLKKAQENHLTHLPECPETERLKKDIEKVLEKVK